MNATVISKVLRALLKWWWLIVVAVALSTGAGYLIRSTQPDLYASTVTLQVGQDPRTAVSSTSSIQAGANLINAYAVFVRRPFILQPVIDDLQLGITVNQFNDLIRLNDNPNASLLEVTVIDTDPDRAAVIANRLGEEAVRQSVVSGSASDPDFVDRQIQNLQTQINELDERYNELVAEAANLTSAFEINQNLADQDSTQAALQTLQTLYAQYLNSTSDMQRQVRIFEPASPVYWPVASTGLLDLIISAAIGGVLAVTTIVLITFFDDRFQWSESDLEAVSGVRVLGPLGIVPRNRLPLYADAAPESLEAEALRQLRAKIVLATENGMQPEVITFASHDSGDGKTLTTTNMALTYARSGERTLIIDGDIRKGDIHEFFQLPNVFGLSDVLASSDPIDELLHEAVLKTTIPNLSLMTAGRHSQDPAALLSSPRFEELVNRLRRRFDVVVFDSAPTIAGQDGVFLAEASDGVVIVVNARRTTQSNFKRTVAALSEGRNVHILGLVVNRVRLQVTSKYSSHYYRHTPGIAHTQLNRELLQPAKGPLSFRSNIIVNKRGERLYSLKAASTQLGVRQQTIKDWCKSGTLASERRGFRRWIHEGEIERMLKGLPTATELVAEEEPSTNGLHKVSSKTALGLPENLREQRKAVLGFVRDPDVDDDEG
ncbi:MAG: polysaccharide biosynthesis tyrosine autokinase [Anaerolineae bacterium]|nr:polysaccharide biosynthesis tyrosine autokinase [Anaerolineae bacterium]